MSVGSTYRRSCDIALVESPNEGRVVVMPLNGTQPYVLTDSAAVIWGLVDGERDITAIVGEIRSQFPDAGPEIRESAQEFLHQLHELELLETTECA